MLALLMLILATFAVVRMNDISAAFERQQRQVAERLDPLYVAREALDQTGLAARNAYIFTDENDAKKELALVDEQKAIYLAALDKLAPAFVGNAAFDKVRSGMLAMAEELKKPRQFREAGQMEAYGKFLVEECSPLRRRIVADIAVMLSAEQKETTAEALAADRLAGDARWWIVVKAGFTFVVSLLISTFITRVLLKELGGEPRYAANIASRIAE